MCHHGPITWSQDHPTPYSVGPTPCSKDLPPQPIVGPTSKTDNRGHSPYTIHQTPGCTLNHWAFCHLWREPCFHKFLLLSTFVQIADRNKLLKILYLNVIIASQQSAFKWLVFNKPFNFNICNLKLCVWFLSNIKI